VHGHPKPHGDCGEGEWRRESRYQGGERRGTHERAQEGRAPAHAVSEPAGNGARWDAAGPEERHHQSYMRGRKASRAEEEREEREDEGGERHDQRPCKEPPEYCRQSGCGAGYGSAEHGSILPLGTANATDKRVHRRTSET